MQRQSYQVKTVLEKKGARKKTFLAFKDSLGNPLSRSPSEHTLAASSEDLGHFVEVYVRVRTVQHSPLVLAQIR